MYEIRLATRADRDSLVAFIREHWKKDHVFVEHPQMLDWQHYDLGRNCFNFILGIEKESGTLHAVLGLIPLAQFDPEIARSDLCWMALWKVHEAARGQKLGRRLMSFLAKELRPTVISTVGASSMTLSMYQELGYQTGRLSHYYSLNPAKREFKLVVPAIAESSFFRLAVPAGRSLKSASAADVEAWAHLFQNDLIPRKTPTYITNRYLRHPVYRYNVFGIKDAENVLGIVVTRTCEHGDARAIRIVDFIGPSTALRGLASEWGRLLGEADAEYIDFYNWGIANADLEAAGFVRRQEDDGAVVPNYFEPFAKCNVEIDFMVSVPIGYPMRIVKGDSDQDRPNLIGPVSRARVKV